MSNQRSFPAFFVGGPINGRTRNVNKNDLVWEVFRSREIVPLKDPSMPQMVVSDVYVRDLQQAGPDGKILFRYMSRSAVPALFGL